MDGWIEYRSLESTLDSNGFIKKSAATTMGCDTIHGLMIGYDPTTRHHGSPLPFCVCFGAHSCFRFVSFRFVALHSFSKKVILVFLRRRRIGGSLHARRFVGGHLVGVVQVQPIVGFRLLVGLALLVGLFLGFLFQAVVFLLFALYLFEAALLALREHLSEDRRVAVVVERLHSRLFEFLGAEIVLLDADPTDVVRAVKADGPVGCPVGLFEVLPPGVDHGDLAFLAPGNGIGLDQRGAIQHRFLRHVVHGHSRFHSKVHVGRGQLIDVKPDVFRVAVPDQQFVLALVLAHVHVKGHRGLGARLRGRRGFVLGREEIDHCSLV
mmetsp:Transcript_9343/g.18628  ORF Transcript_9343/g.18628 Transcript_9343/m.18628 type:complete len:323 (-) Transcript_9343:74-1042(-)